MISTEGFLKTLNLIENLSREKGDVDDYDLGKVLSSHKTNASECKHKIRYSDGQERTFLFEN